MFAEFAYKFVDSHYSINEKSPGGDKLIVAKTLSRLDNIYNILESVKRYTTNIADNRNLAKFS
jgi:hypothetical protein